MRNLLMTKELERTLPPLYAQEGKRGDAIVYAHYFTPRSNWDWYVLEYDPNDKLFFGYVCGLENEYGYFSIAEFEELNHNKIAPVVERDLYWEPKTLSEVRKE